MRISFSKAIERGWIDQGQAPAGARKDKPRRGEIEGDEQSELIALFRERFPVVGSLLIHIPNGGFRKNAFEGYRLKRQGVRAGVSDLLLPVARGGFFGLWIEFKAAPPNDAAITPAQREWVELMAEQGYRAMVCLGVDSALEALESYMALPPTIASIEAAASSRPETGDRAC
jgi:hypothetical protein